MIAYEGTWYIQEVLLVLDPTHLGHSPSYVQSLSRFEIYARNYVKKILSQMVLIHSLLLLIDLGMCLSWISIGPLRCNILDIVHTFSVIPNALEMRQNLYFAMEVKMVDVWDDNPLTGKHLFFSFFFKAFKVGRIL